MKSIISFLLILSTFPGIASSNPGQKISIVFRFDDYRLKSDPISDSLIYIFSKHNIPLCLGVIPFNNEGVLYNELDPEQLNTLRGKIRNNEIEIALHGFNHIDNKIIKRSLIKKSAASEFSSLDFNDQFIKIKKGKSALDSLLNIKTDIFIPPFNSYDNNTIRALDSLKFKVISASIDGYSGSDKISYMPFTTSDLTELAEICKSNLHDNPTIIIVLHPYSFAGEFAGYISRPVYINQLDTLLSWIKVQNNLITTDFSKLSNSEIFDNKRFVLNSTNRNMLTKILNKLKIYRYGVFNTTDYLTNHKSIMGICNILFHAIIFICIYLVTKAFSRMIRSFKVLRLIFLTLFIIIIIGVLYKAVHSHSLIIYLELITAISLAFIVGIIKGNQNEKVI